MAGKKLTIAITGTFDVLNYGDLLFPLLMEKELCERLGDIDVLRFSYQAKAPPSWPYSVHALEELPSYIPDVDALVVGGGHLIRFDKTIASGYGPSLDVIHHPTGYWLIPAFLIAIAGKPVVWNGVGASPNTPSWARAMLSSSLVLSEYVSVRDQSSLRELGRIAPTVDCKLVPDSAFGVGRLVRREDPSLAFTEWQEAHGLEKYVLMQSSPFLQSSSHQIEKALQTLQARDYRIVEAPIGPILGDEFGVVGIDVPDIIPFEDWRDPILLTNVIAHSSCVIAQSLHLSISALCFGVPVFRMHAPKASKYEILDAFRNVHFFGRDEDNLAGRILEKIGRVKVSDDIIDQCSQLRIHWDTIAELVTRSLSSNRAPKVRFAADFFFQLPNQLETTCDWENLSRERDRLKAERLAELEQLKQAVSERDARIADLTRIIADRDWRILALDGSLSDRDTQIADLKQANVELATRTAAIENSWIWKITSPLRQALGSTPILTKICRRVAKLVWWTTTFQLRKQLSEWRARNRQYLKTPHFAPPKDDNCLGVPLGYFVGQWESAPHLAVICHMFYADLADEFRRYLGNIPFTFDLFITTDSEDKRSTIQRHFSQWKQGHFEVRIAPNRGRDIAPKLITCRDVYDKYEFVLHIHSKKSPQEDAWSGWRFYLLQTLLGSEKIVKSVFEAFRAEPKLGMIAPQHFEPVRQSIGWGWNFENARNLCQQMGINISLDGQIDFPSGSMFWARSAALAPLLNCGLATTDFPIEQNQPDGTLSHVIERLYFFICERAGYRWIKIIDPSLAASPKRIECVDSESELSSFIKNSQCELLKSQGRKWNPLRKLVPISLISDAIHRKRQLVRLAYAQSECKSLSFQQFQHELELHIAKKKSLINFDEAFYLKANPDVAVAVNRGAFPCGYIHYCLRGQYEGRLWSNRQLERVFYTRSNLPDGMVAPVNIRHVARDRSDLSRLPKSPRPFLLILFSHLQEDLFFAGYVEFFFDFAPLFGRFSRIVLSVESDTFDPRLATRYSDRIEVIKANELRRLEYLPDLILCFNHDAVIKAKQVFKTLNKTVYYCQDFESGFFPYGARYVEAERAVAISSNIVVSTGLLKDFLVNRNLITNQRVFTTSPKIEPFNVLPEKRNRIFFYFRPESFHQRNLPEILMEATHDFCTKHSGYEIYMVGTVDTRYSFKINETPVYIMSKLPRKDYIELISSCDIVVSMIYSAHPGVIAFQAAASGIPTVTNVFENRNAGLLRQISENIVPYDPVRDNLLELIEKALDMPKGVKSFNDQLYSGRQKTSLSDFIDTILCSK